MARFIIETNDETGELVGEPMPWEDPVGAAAGGFTGPTDLGPGQYSPENAEALFTNPSDIAGFLDRFRSDAGYNKGGETIPPDPLSAVGYSTEKFNTDPMFAYSRFITPPAKVGPILWLGGSPVPIPPQNPSVNSQLMLSYGGEFMGKLADVLRKKSMLTPTGGGEGGGY